jgi:hypothetical protein
MFHAAEWRALLAIASGDSCRLSLYGIAIDLDHGSVFATDGHRLLAATPDGEMARGLAGGPLVFPGDDAARVAKAAGSRGWIVLSPERDHAARGWRVFAIPGPSRKTDREAREAAIVAAVTAGETITDATAATWGAAVFTVREPGATPPPWRTVCPAFDPMPTDGPCSIVVNAAYLADAAAVLAGVAANAGGMCSITVHPASTPLDPLGLATRIDGCTWRYVLMPMRADAVSVGLQGHREPAAAAAPSTDAAVLPMGGKRRRKAG